jgi:hypothetical protein
LTPPDWIKTMRHARHASRASALALLLVGSGTVAAGDAATAPH